MKWFMHYRRRIGWALLVILALPFCLYGGSLLGFFPWSPINCTHKEVDIYSGRIRFSRYLLWLKVEESIADSPLTRALQPSDYAETKSEWHSVVTFSPGLRHSPHYRFHSAQYQISELNLIWQFADFAPPAKRASARRVLELWQQTGSDSRAGRYLWDLNQLVMLHEKNPRPIDESDLQKLLSPQP